jgi:hypothetical protein
MAYASHSASDPIGVPSIPFMVGTGGPAIMGMVGTGEPAIMGMVGTGEPAIMGMPGGKTAHAQEARVRQVTERVHLRPVW